MSNLETLPIFTSLFNEAQKKKEYDDLNANFRLLRTKVESNKIITEENEFEFEKLIRTQCKRVIADRFNEISTKITTRNTSGQNFTENQNKIEKIRSTGENDLEIHRYFELFNDLDYQEKEVDEKIYNETTQKKESWKLLYIGIIVGDFLTLLTIFIKHVFK